MHAAVRHSSRAIALLRIVGIIVAVGKAPAAVAGGHARSATAVTGRGGKGVARLCAGCPADVQRHVLDLEQEVVNAAAAAAAVLLKQLKRCLRTPTPQQLQQHAMKSVCMERCGTGCPQSRQRRAAQPPRRRRPLHRRRIPATQLWGHGMCDDGVINKPSARASRTVHKA
jgi:hypothetical protein